MAVIATTSLAVPRDEAARLWAGGVLTVNVR